MDGENEAVESEVNEVEVGAEPEAASAPEASVAEPVAAPAPANDEWRGRYDSLERELNALKQSMQRPVEAPVAPFAPAAAAQAPSLPKHFSSPQAYAKWCEAIRGNPEEFVGGIRSMVETFLPEVLKSDRERIAAFEKKHKEYDESLRGLAGFTRLAEHRFAESPRWQKHGKAVMDLFEKQIVNASNPDALKHAFEIAERQALRAGATPAQAQAAGVKAAQNVAAAAPKKPEPRDEPSLRGGEKRAVATVPVGGSKKIDPSNADYFRRLAERAVKQAAAKGR